MKKINDINVDINGINFLCRSCAVVRNDNKVLFQKRKNDKYWALPGGKIEVLETTKETIKRELQEELNIEDISVGKVISVVENFFEINNKKIHQYIFTHEVTFNDTKYNEIKKEFDGAEKNKDVIFTWIKKEDIKNTPVKPDYVKDMLLKGNNQVEFSTCIEN